jgi:hypothetical protein
MESLFAMVGRLPLELVLVSFLFQVVGSYVNFDMKTLMGAVMKRLLASHRTLQVCLDLPFPLCKYCSSCLAFVFCFLALGWLPGNHGDCALLHPL